MNRTVPALLLAAVALIVGGCRHGKNSRGDKPQINLESAADYAESYLPADTFELLKAERIANTYSKKPKTLVKLTYRSKDSSFPASHVVLYLPDSTRLPIVTRAGKMSVIMRYRVALDRMPADHGKITPFTKRFVPWPSHGGGVIELGEQRLVILTNATPENQRGHQPASVEVVLDYRLKLVEVRIPRA